MNDAPVFLAQNSHDIATWTDVGDDARERERILRALEGWTFAVVINSQVALLHPRGWRYGTGYLSRTWLIRFRRS